MSEERETGPEHAGGGQVAASETGVTTAAESDVQPVQFGSLASEAAAAEGGHNLDLLMDITIPIAVEVGRTQMSLSDILDLVPGSIVALDKKSEEPVDLRVNGKLVARGEVVLVDDTYGLRVTQILDAAGRIESLRQG